ncbi:hypothetical protein DBV15_11210 [Temnothorax longispinosus]|uniref:Uncharacterized protein n=1 Tax=Temnothorax longispinosus TaxID=300112 RepID=A0A4S2JLA1_9HYME|nr:hypothetical protein DBV15_11210 [Temnothorax longispinosus]
MHVTVASERLSLWIITRPLRVACGGAASSATRTSMHSIKPQRERHFRNPWLSATRLAASSPPSMCAAHWLVYARVRPPRVNRATTASPKIRHVHMIAPPLRRRRRSPPAAPVSPPPRATVIIHYYIYRYPPPTPPPPSPPLPPLARAAATRW